MAAWFSRGTQVGTTKEFRRALDAVLAQVHPPLAGKIRDFVLSGGDSGWLPQLAPGAFGQQQVLLTGHIYGIHPQAGPYQQLTTAMGDVSPDVLLRWAQVVEACFGPSAWAFELADLDGGHTVESLLLVVANTHQAQLQKPSGTVPLAHSTLEDVLATGGSPRSSILVRAFHQNPQRYMSGLGRLRPLLRRMPGYEDAVQRHAPELRPHVAAGDVRDRLVAAEMLQGLSRETLALFADELAQLATASGAQVREVAAPLVITCGSAASEPLRALATNGKPDQRLQALRLLWSHATDEEDRAWAQRTAAEDRAASVQALAVEWAAEASAADEPDIPLEAGPRPVIDWAVTATPALHVLVTQLWEDANRDIERTNEMTRRAADAWAAQHGQRPAWANVTAPMAAADANDLLRRMTSGRPPRASNEPKPRVEAHHVRDALPKLATSPEASLPVLGHLLHHFGLLVDWRGGLNHTAAACFNGRQRALAEPSLSQVAVLYDDMGLDGTNAVMRSWSSTWGERVGQGWPREAVAPFVAEHLDAFAAGLGRQTDWYSRTDAVYEALSALDRLPRQVTEALWPVALTGLKAHRRLAQDVLRATPDRDARVATALADGKGDVRTEAARWIARDHISSAVPALEAAFAKEKQDVAKGALLDALEALGQPVETYLDRDRLAADAAKTVAKGLPKDVDWFPWDALPEVRWADNGQLVAPITLQHLFAQAVKAKSPEPNALLRRYCSLFEPADRERLGQLVLDTWVAQDLRPVDRATAEAAAARQASSTFHWMQTYPQHFKDDPTYGLSVDQLTAHFLPGALRQPAGSATASKGLLAVAAACAGERAAATASRYLQEWYGMRASQGKALIAMLAWVDHPSATQLVLSVGSRFRTKSFQDEATRQAEALAERKGWTLTELADRTIPTAGLDEDGVLRLSYGDRTFTAALLPDLSLELRNPDGKKVASLPTPRQTDDEGRAKESKKALAAARKEVKAVLKLQAERLYEALCTDRDWSFEDWDRYLNHHPLMHLLVQRLVWTASTSDEAPVVFRPLDDHTLTDVDDTEVVVKPDARVRLAHDSNLSPDDVQAWQEHLADYEVSPLFQQFGKGIYALDEAKADAREIEDFRGSLVEAFRLRGRATRLGYTRGAPGDGGWFSTYEKRFPTLGLTSVVSFSGNSLPEENRTVALISLSFERRAEQAGAATTTLRLREVPEVLLSEAWNDVRILAGEGTGPDPDWEKKVTY
ncbi:protein of unknown function [Pedococcus cremeus]|uniref:DUF4132 domain-containing protein n=1 Tax=Pedococcus cremeus TaxID=587636 RepID=A0A1H9WN63_9MICO|nr:DUF4132 domain-containing protein [Pedococcus cremeus]SES35315.1 protein of unknown function [Pedococcus cremeus]